MPEKNEKCGRADNCPSNDAEAEAAAEQRSKDSRTAPGAEPPAAVDAVGNTSSSARPRSLGVIFRPAGLRSAIVRKQDRMVELMQRDD